MSKKTYIKQKPIIVEVDVIEGKQKPINVMIKKIVGGKK